jgi:tetratricopeptide (TPR) repeat protein
MNLREFLSVTLVGAASLTFNSPAWALTGDLGTRFTVDDLDPKASVPKLEDRNQYPVEFGYWLQDLVARAETSFTEQKWEPASKYFEALIEVAPERALSFTRLCTCYEQLGKLDEARAQCRAALTKGGVRVHDHLHYLRLALSAPNLDSAAIADATASIEHVREHLKSATAPSVEGVEKLITEAQGGLEKDKQRAPDTDTGTNSLALQLELLACQLGVRTSDRERLGQCTTKLAEAGSPESLIVPFRWALAAVDHGAQGMQAAIDRAQAIGMPKEAIEGLTRGLAIAEGTAAPGQLAHPKPTATQSNYGLRALLVVCAMAAITLLGWVFARVRLRRHSA